MKTSLPIRGRLYFVLSSRDETPSPENTRLLLELMSARNSAYAPRKRAASIEYEAVSTSSGRPFEESEDDIESKSVTGDDDADVSRAALRNNHSGGERKRRTCLGGEIYYVHDFSRREGLP